MSLKWKTKTQKKPKLLVGEAAMQNKCLRLAFLVKSEVTLTGTLIVALSVVNI